MRYPRTTSGGKADYGEYEAIKENATRERHDSTHQQASAIMALIMPVLMLGACDKTLNQLH